MSSQVVRFYERRCVLVTGGTGFMGRVLIEKLLRSCHDISKIYLLLRTKAGGEVQDRLKDITEIPVSFYLNWECEINDNVNFLF